MELLEKWASRHRLAVSARREAAFQLDVKLGTTSPFGYEGGLCTCVPRVPLCHRFYLPFRDIKYCSP